MKKAFVWMLAAGCLVPGAGFARKKAKPAATALTYVRMNRTPCFGRCPTYALELYSNGTARYSGYQFTDHQGVYEKKFSPQAAQAFLNEFARYRPDTARAEYPVMIADLPMLHYIMRFGSKTKNVQNANFGPSYFQAVSKEMDARFAVDGSWKKIADTAIVR